MKGRRSRSTKRRFERCWTFFLSFLLLSVTVFTGCSPDGSKSSEEGEWIDSIYHYSDVNHAQAGDWLFYRCEYELVAENRITGDIYPVNRSAVMGEQVYQFSAIYSDGENVYYLRKDGSDFLMTDGRHEIDSLYLVGLRAADFQEQQIVKERPDGTFFSMFSGEKSPYSDLDDIAWGFLIEGNELLYVDENNYLMRMSLVTGKIDELFTLEKAFNWACGGKTVYAINEDRELVLYALDTGEETVTPDVSASYLYVSEEGIYFLNLMDNKCVYLWSFALEKPVKITESAASAIWCDEEHLYYRAAGDLGLYCVEKADGSARKILDENVNDLYLFDGVPYLYAQIAGQKLVKIDKATWEVIE